MKSIKYFAFALLSSALLFSACSKDESTTTPTVAGSTYLVGKDWRMIAATLSTAGVPTVDMFAAMQPCEKDNLLEFLTSGLITEKEGATKCDPTDPDTAPYGAWTLLNSDKQLRIIDGDTTLMDVVELNASSLKVKVVEVDMGVTYTTSYSFVKN
jgi:hypothetical protein